MPKTTKKNRTEAECLWWRKKNPEKSRQNVLAWRAKRDKERARSFKNKDGSMNHWQDSGVDGALYEDDQDANARYFWLYTKHELTAEDKAVLRGAMHVWHIQVMRFQGFMIYYCKTLMPGYKFQDLVNLEFTLSQKVFYNIFYPDVCRDKKKRWVDVV